MSLDWEANSTVQRYQAAGQQSHQVATQAVHMLPQAMNRTDELVWPEDEQHEDEARRVSGLGPVPPLPQEEAEAALREVRVSLPDVLLPQAPADVDAARLPGNLAHLTPVHVGVPMSFDAPESMRLRRVQMSVMIHQPLQAIYLWLVPPSLVHSTTGDVADFGIDLGKLVALAFPQIPPAFTLKVDKHFDHTGVQPVVQASGAQTRVCTWRVSDSEMAYEFQPSIVVATTPGEGLTLTAELHVEVRKRILGVFHKTYGKSARPQRYEMSYTEAGLVPKGWSKISKATREEAAMPPEKQRHLPEIQRIYDQYNEGRGDG